MAANRRQLYKYKGDKCSACGETVGDMITKYGTFNRLFELNHVDPAQKHPKYKNLIRRVISTEQLDEVDKCVLLCDRCHNVLHAQNINAELLVTVIVGRKQAEQRLKGQMVFNRLEKKGTFLTNEPVVVWPYRVHLGGRKPKTAFGDELRNRLLVSYIRRITEYRSVVIRGWNKEIMFRASYKGGDQYRIEQDIRFPLLTAELRADEDKPIKLWVRNGVALTRDGEVIRDGTLSLSFALPE